MTMFLLLPIFVQSLFPSTPLQTLNEPTGIVWFIDMSRNGEFMVLRDPSTVHLYYNNGSHFVKEKGFAIPAIQRDSLDITADGEWMLVVDHYSYFRIYSYNHAINSF